MQGVLAGDCSGGDELYAIEIGLLTYAGHGHTTDQGNRVVDLLGDFARKGAAS